VGTPAAATAQILTEHLGWSYDRYETWLADAIERLVLND
jgi:hypothetical protein